MPDDDSRHFKGTVRLPFLHYNESGAYAITLVASNRECLFGIIESERIVANEFSLIVLREWMKSPTVRPGLTVDVFCLMPTHLHGIVWLPDGNTAASHAQMGHGQIPRGSVGEDAHSCAALPRGSRVRGKHSISSLVAGFKATTTKRINEVRGTPGQAVWQPKFYDHVIRNEEDLFHQRQYILDNPLQWELDKENPNRNR